MKARCGRGQGGATFRVLEHLMGVESRIIEMECNHG